MKFTKLKKWGLAFGSLTAIAAPVAAVVACGDDDSRGDTWQFDSHRESQIIYGTPDGRNMLNEITDYMTPYKNFKTTSQWYPIPYQNDMAISFFRSVKPERDRLIKDANGNVVRIETNDSMRDTQQRFAFVNSVTLTAGGTEYVFDEDDDILNLDDPNSKDINSKHFQDVMKGANGPVTNITFGLPQEDHYWTNQFSGEQTYRMTARDFYAGLTFVAADATKERAKASFSGLGFDYNVAGENPVDKISAEVSAAASLLDPIDIPSANDSGGLLEVLESEVGVSQTVVDAIHDEAKMSTIIPDDYTISLDLKGTKTGQSFWQAYDTYINGSFYMMMSYEQIREMHGKHDKELDALAQGVITDDEFKAFKKSPLYRSGYFQSYLAERDEFSIGGIFYISKSTDKLLTFEQNPRYVDERYLNQKNREGELTTLKTLRFKFIKNTPLETANLQQFSEYKTGTSVYAPFSNISFDDQYDALNNYEDWGMSFSRGYTSSSLTGDFSYLSVLPFQNASETSYQFNDNFAQLMYGGSLQALQDPNDNSFTGEDMIAHMAGGDGFLFRKYLAASQNAYSMSKNSTKDNQSDWTTNIPPEMAIYGFGDGTDLNDPYTSTNPLFLSDQLLAGQSATYGEDAALSQFIPTFDANGNLVMTQLTRDSYVEQYEQGQGHNAYGPSQTPDPTSGVSPYDELKEDFRALLTDFFEDQGIPAAQQIDPDTTSWQDVPENQVIAFEMPYGRSFTKATALDAYSAWRDVLLDIDPRLQVVAVTNPMSSLGDGSDFSIEKNEFPATQSELGIAFQANDPNAEYPLEDRIFYWSEGTITWAALNNFASLTAPYPVEGIFPNFGWLQNGNMLLLSYYADPANQSAYANTPGLEGLKPFTDAITGSFTQYQIDHASDLDTMLQSSKAATFKQELTSMKFSDIWKSDPIDITVADYLGFAGLDELANEYKRIYGDPTTGTPALDATTYTDDDKLIISDLTQASNWLNLYINGASNFVWPYLENSPNPPTTEEVTQMLTAWSIVKPENFNPITGVIGDRQIINPELTKNWFYAAGMDLSGTLVGSFQRVDLDFDPVQVTDTNGNPTGEYYDTAVYQDANGDFKTFEEGGIVY